MRQPNVRVRPNVLCQSLHAMDTSDDDLSVRDSQLVPRLAYWEILEFARECPLRFGGGLHRRERLTVRQQIELEKYLDPGRNVRHLWPVESERTFEPFPATQVAHPFFALVADETPAVPPVTLENFAPPQPVEESDRSETQSRVPNTRRVHSVEDRSQIDHLRDDEQAEIIKAPSGQHQVVLAPPGTGKTYVLIKRLRQIVETREVENPALEILVLSFSRAAVAEIARRIGMEASGDVQDDLRYVQVRTFDSYATRMLTRGEPDGVHLESGFQRRINQFRTAVVRGILPDAARDELSRVRFLIVDEVQDLVGERARMTLTILESVIHHGGTVLLLGDPAQAIYDWQLDDADTMTSSEFLSQARALLRKSQGTLKEVPLSNYRRFETPMLLNLVRRCRIAIGEDGRRPDLSSLTNQLQSLPSVPLQYLRGTQDSTESTALLTRTNLEAFQISEWCRQHGIAHRVERGSSGRYWPGWLSRLCLEYKMDKMPLETARQRWAAFIAPREWASFEQAHDYLRRHGLFCDDVLNVHELSALVERSQPQCPWPPDETSSLVISTIHRSKGLEFDRVLLLKAPPDGFSAGDTDEGQGEARLIYVAATRAKKSLAMLMRESSVLRRGFKSCKGYWFSKLNHFHLFDRERNKNYLLLDGLDEFDLDAVTLSASGLFAVATQTAIWDTCVGGAAILKTERNSAGELSWTLPGGQRLCALSRDLSASLFTLGKTYRGGNPEAVRQLNGVPVVDVASVSYAWDGGKAAESHLGSAKLAMVPVVYGLAAVDLVS